MAAREGKGARPGMLRGGRDARGGTEGGRGGCILVSVMSCGAGPGNKCLPVDPTGKDTELRSGRGRLRLGRLGRGGKPPARGIRPIITQTPQDEASPSF